MGIELFNAKRAFLIVKYFKEGKSLQQLSDEFETEIDYIEEVIRFAFLINESIKQE